MVENYFAGSFDQLRTHWENKDRAIKFRQGQTRTEAVHFVVKHHENHIHQGSWLDTGVGAGYVQTVLDKWVSPCLHVGLDFSLKMLQSHSKPFGELIRASTFSLPFRTNSFDLVTNIFSLSDYPNIKGAFIELVRATSKGGRLSHTDYAKGDEYWEARKKVHGTLDNEKSMIVGNINLRTLSSIRNSIPEGTKINFQTLIKYQVDPNQMNASFELPVTITRRFIFTEIQK